MLERTEAAGAQESPSHRVQNSGQTPILWEGRHVELKPSWYQVAEIMRAVGSCLLGAAPLLGLGAYHSYENSNPAPQWTGLAGASAAALILGGALRFSPYWNDPAFRLREGKKTWADIQHSRLPYPQIMTRYGSKIKAYEILTQMDLRRYLLAELGRMPWDQFKAKHSLEGCLLVKGEILAKEKVLDALGGYGYAGIKHRYGEELGHGFIGGDDLENLLIMQCENKTLKRVMAEQGDGFWEIFADEILPPRFFKPMALRDSDLLSINEIMNAFSSRIFTTGILSGEDVFPSGATVRERLLEDLKQMPFSEFRKKYCKDHDCWDLFRAGVLKANDFSGTVEEEIERLTSLPDLLDVFGWEAFEFGVLKGGDNRICTMAGRFLSTLSLQNFINSLFREKLAKHGVLPTDLAKTFDHLDQEATKARVDRDAVVASARRDFETKRALSEAGRDSNIARVSGEVTRLNGRLQGLQMDFRAEIREIERNFSESSYHNDARYHTGITGFFGHFFRGMSNKREYWRRRSESEAAYNRQVAELEIQIQNTKEHLGRVVESENERHQAEVDALALKREHAIQQCRESSRRDLDKIERQYQDGVKKLRDGNI